MPGLIWVTLILFLISSLSVSTKTLQSKNLRRVCLYSGSPLKIRKFLLGTLWDMCLIGIKIFFSCPLFLLKIYPSLL